MWEMKRQGLKIAMENQEAALRRHVALVDEEVRKNLSKV